MTDEKKAVVAEVVAPAAAALDKDEQRLNELGYRQELRRELSTFTNYGVSLSVVCVVSGLTTLFGTGLTSGGPVVLVFGWIVVSFFTMMVGLSMAEITSAFPTSGGLYFWAAMLSPPSWKPAMSWFTGWFNLCGQMALTTGVFFGLSSILAATASVGMSYEDDTGALVFPYSPLPWHIVVIHIGLSIVTGLANMLPARMMARILSVSTVVQIIAPFLIIVVILARAPTHQTGSFVFTTYVNETGLSSDAWCILVGLLVAQYTLTGYDASAHVTEETRRADVAGPVGIILAIGVSTVTGFLYILGALFSLQDYDATVGTATGLPLVQIFLDASGRNATLVLLVVLLLANWFCCYSSLIGNSRMIYAFSRDGAMPLSKFLHKIDHRFDLPINALWFSVAIDCILILIYLGNTTAFTAITSITTIGLYISYALPIACRLIWADRFHPGPFSLGRFSKPIGAIAVLWVSLITVLFVLPTVAPLTPVNMNYAVVMVGAVFVGAGFAWVVSARKWFHGPVINLTAEERTTVNLDVDVKGEDIVDAPEDIHEVHHEPGHVHPAATA
ncbi:hypothetical protein HK405_009787 [Cladochytrium tenue]|nr:hypothetical protein HK405_009787 [Cladochytrium tenue]